MAGRPLLLAVNGVPRASSASVSGARFLTPMQKCLSFPPCAGRNSASVGSGLGSSIRWTISGPIISHAPSYGSLSFGRSGFTGRPRKSR